MVRLERENLALIRDQMGQGRPIAGIMTRSAVDCSIAVAGTDRVRQWAVQRKLLPDQIDAAVLTLTTPHWASAIEGLAGSAKTSLVGALREYVEGNGWTVRGLGVTTGSVKALQDAGINAQTIAKTLAAASLPPKQGPELWIIDESSLLATPSAHRLLKAAEAQGVERIVFVGDQKQHLAIEAGSPVRQFLADHMAVAQLTTIRRQQDPELRRAVELAANGQTSAAIELLDQQKRVVQVPDFAARYERIANDYLDAYEARQRCLVVSPGNDERRALNQAIRTTLISHGYVNPRGHDHQVLINRDLSPAQLQNPPSCHENDVVHFVRGSSKQGIPKKAYLTVAAVKEHSLTLRESGSSLDFNPARFKGLRVYTTETRTIAVGDRIQWREPDNPRRIANGESAVIKDLTHKHIQVAFDHGRQFRLPLDQTRHIDLGYATTSHASQGSTVDRVIINIDSKRNPDLVNQRQFYVSLSRPRADARVYTDDAKAMRHAVARKQEKELALDVAQPKQTRTRGPSFGRR
jgi:ATP-dependent exoDNAse (exonuclease V) alpha subunit